MPAKHIVIVGGSSGIGLATARDLLAAGDDVTITGRDEARLARAKSELGERARTVRMDAAAVKTLPQLFARIGRLDHLVLSSGSGRGMGPFREVDITDVRRGFEEKVYAHFAAAQAALPYISDSGSITFVSAIGVMAAVPGTAGISAANAAITALVPILAVELKPLRVNCVAPGVIDTPWWDAMPVAQKDAFFREFITKTPVGRNGRVDDVSQAIVFLIRNGFTTGHTLPCDGGVRFLA